MPNMPNNIPAGFKQDQYIPDIATKWENVFRTAHLVYDIKTETVIGRIRKTEHDTWLYSLPVEKHWRRVARGPKARKEAVEKLRGVTV